ncbi:MAG: GNAT family N-acetyltransferase [Bowdeniella nasicola]|nr:GNAT family N-acetyltransferase [Bowdeniella nasicola]
MTTSPAPTFPRTITTERLVLKTPTVGDVEALCTTLNDPTFERYLTLPQPYTENDAIWFISSYLIDRIEERLCTYLLYTQAGELVGNVSLMNRVQNRAELGYWAAPQARGQGYITEAGRAVLHYAFTHDLLDQVHIHIRTDNAASLATARRIGFTMWSVIPGLIPTRTALADGWIGGVKAADFLAGTSAPPRTVTEQVLQFHRTYGMVIGQGPARVDHPDMAMRLRLIAEEFCELVEASRGVEAAETVRQALSDVEKIPVDADLIATADALGDLTYVIYGLAILANIPLDDVISEIHRSNMTKLGADGKPIKREDGKILKGPNFSPPNIAEVVSLS